jgi:hypothetical protein
MVESRRCTGLARARSAVPTERVDGRAAPSPVACRPRGLFPADYSNAGPNPSNIGKCFTFSVMSGAAWISAVAATT